MKTILLPTDFSSVASNAMDYALTVYGDEPVHYILLNAFVVQPGPEGKSYQEEQTDHKAKLDEEEKIWAAKINDQSKVSTILHLGNIDYLSNELLEENKVDLVIMGTEGVGEVERYIGKSHAGEFVSHVNKNTLVIPSCADCKTPQNILFTTNYRNVKNDKTLGVLKHILDKYNANLFVLYVNKEGTELTSYQNEVKGNLEEYFNGNKVSFHEFIAGNVEDQVEDFMNQYNIDMVSAVPQHNTFLERIFHNSLVKRLAEHSTKPVVILNDK